MKKHMPFFVLVLLVGAPAAAVVGAVDDLVAVVPETTDAILANPDMGWETFHRTGGQDRNLPAWLPSTVQYARWGWADLEPEPGRLDVEFLDRILKECRESGQRLAFRVMCCSTSRGAPYHPAWLKDLGGKEIDAQYEHRTFPIPDLDDPVVLERHLDFLKRLGARYDGHPDIAHVDIGSVGWWGEWHLSGGSSDKMPSLETRRKIVDAYLSAFQKTPLVMLIGGGPMLTYAIERGAGWRADCLGDLGGFGGNWCHMRKGYPGWFQEAGIEDVWKRSPVAFESCWDMRKWVDEGWSLRYIFNYALACHASVVNNKSAPLPPGEHVRPELERFLRRLGHRLVLERLTHPARVAPGETFTLASTWRNTGSAPCYKPYRLAYRLSNENGRVWTNVGAATVDRWLPGSVELFTESFLNDPPDLPPGEANQVDEPLTPPRDLPAGIYQLSLAIVDATAAEDGNAPRPVLQLGIKGRADDGWYPLSNIEIAPTREPEP